MSARDCCGIFGVTGHPDAAYLTYLGLYALQHRGQEGAGIVSEADGELWEIKGSGLVNDVFPSRDDLRKLRGRSAIGHVRYSTTGTSHPANIQPFVIKYHGGPVGIAHNGNLTNSKKLKTRMENAGSIFRMTSDTELFLHMIARSNVKGFTGGLIEACSQARGAYSLVLIRPDRMYAVRDPMGFRPLSLGRLDGAYVVASETCAFDLIGASYERDVRPGEVIEFSGNGIEEVSRVPASDAPISHCMFEFVYFARPDSRVFGEKADKVRRALGRALAEADAEPCGVLANGPADDMVVISVPDLSNTAALGYAQQSGVHFEIGLIRNHYVGRTFIQPTQEVRDLDARVKYNPVEGVLKGRRVIVVDDSIVRGTTSRKLVSMVRGAGANEVHFRVASAPVVSPCFYGIDMPTRAELAASSCSVQEIRDTIDADTLRYLTVEQMTDAAVNPERRENGGDGRFSPSDFCLACFTGEYRTQVDVEGSKYVLE